MSLHSPGYRVYYDIVPKYSGTGNTSYMWQVLRDLVRGLFLFAVYRVPGGGRMLLKACNRCGTLIQYGATYCTICAPIVEAEREAKRIEYSKASNKRYNKTRDPKYGRFYNSNDWKILSRKRLQDDGYKCVKCGKIASEVDHIEAIQTPSGWERRLDYTNTQSLCIECHNKKHERFLRKKKKFKNF